MARENVALEQNTARAEREWTRRKRAWARRTGAKIHEDPARHHAALSRSAFGCDWLIGRWEELAAELEAEDPSKPAVRRACRLLGLEKPPDAIGLQGAKKDG